MTTAPRSTRAWPASSSTPPPISKVAPETNSLTYRGYPVQELAATCSFEEVAYLLWHGELPTAPSWRCSSERERAARRAGPIAAVAARPAARQLPPHGRAAHRGQPACGAEDPTEDDSAASSQPRQGRLRLLAGAADGRRRSTSAAAAGWRRSRRTPTSGSPRTSSTCASARCPSRRSSAAFEVVADPVRRAQLQRLHLHRPGGDLDAVRHLQRGHRRDRRAQGAAARRRQRGRDARCMIEIGDPAAAAVAARRARPQGQDHGLRPPRLQERRLPGADHEGGAGACRGARGGPTLARIYGCWSRRRMFDGARASTPTSTSRPGRPTT